MKRSQFDDTRDDQTSVAKGPEKTLMCAANGCPLRWSTSDGNVCQHHAGAERHDWPLLTQQLQWDETERARRSGEPPVQTERLSFADKREILANLSALPKRWACRDPKAWAHAMRAREEAGEPLNGMERASWRRAVGSDAASAGATP